MDEIIINPDPELLIKLESTALGFELEMMSPCTVPDKLVPIDSRWWTCSKRHPKVSGVLQPKMLLH